MLGFAVERVDPAKDECYYVHGFKVFPSIVPQPDQNTYVIAVARRDEPDLRW
jgi:hypothetical protein